MSWLLLTLPVRDGVYQEGSGGCNFIDEKLYGLECLINFPKSSQLKF